MAKHTTEKPHRFYKEATGAAFEDGYAVLLDGRPARTPGGVRLQLPMQALADLLAAEWTAQVGKVDFESMPATRLAFTVLDRAGAVRAEIAAGVARFAGSDVLCYFAEGPGSLVRREHAAWDPWRDWAVAELDLSLLCSTGISPLSQPAASTARAEALALELDDFGLSGLSLAAALLGSAVLAFAVQRRALSAVEALAISRIDEIFQEERWGVDSEAAARVAGLEREAAMIDAWFAALRVLS
ncbi:MAG: ATP12 family protein [Caulobacteraceae bacterium]